ncbi:hypothetical protein TWF694_011510 [Orbilia ellipsospora]|uniref:Gamma-glutamylcyclotransferase AIG2-like domain-containing protein n=1 Tax=Orbilia ellipsospora TaxID=2528407 RepID=A0AAV9X5E8_9PEZI
MAPPCTPEAPGGELSPDLIRARNRPHRGTMIMTLKFENHWRYAPPPTPEPWKPTPLFLIGNLANPEFLQALLGLTKPPTLEPAMVTRFKYEIKDDGLVIRGLTVDESYDEPPPVHGSVWEIQDERHLQKLDNHLDKFTLGYTNITISKPDGSVEVDGMAFIWGTKYKQPYRFRGIRNQSSSH